MHRSSMGIVGLLYALGEFIIHLYARRLYPQNEYKKNLNKISY